MNSQPPAAQLELDDALLKRAWRLQRPASWPATFEATMVDPVRAQMVQMFARQLQRSEAAVLASGSCNPPVPPATPHMHERRRHALALAPGFVDRKRAAAGDRDDD